MEDALGIDQFTSAAQRQARLLEHLRIEGFADAQVLKDAFGVSIATVRRDLNELEARGLLKRTHGGATIINQSTRINHSFRGFKGADQQLTNAEEKRRIGEAAAELIIEGDSVMIDNGTTSLEVCRRLASRKSLTFVTNSPDAFALLAAAGAPNVHVIGGEYMEQTHCTAGPMAIENIERFSVDKAILSVAAVDVSRAMAATLTPTLGAVQRAMMEAAKTSILVADNTKFDRSALSMVAPLDEIDHIVTDAKTKPLVRSLSEGLRAKFIFV